MPELSPKRQEAWSTWLSLHRAALRADGLPDEDRRAMQDAVNPAYIPRNHVLLKVIADVEDGNFSEVLFMCFRCGCSANVPPALPITA